MRCVRAICAALAASLLLTAAKTPVLVTLASWHTGKDKAVVMHVQLTEQLSKRQKDLISSGFSTHSELEIKTFERDDQPEQILFRSQCTVKFDTWEEIYDIARIDTDFATVTAKSFEAYSDMCLTARVSGAALMIELAKTGGSVRATLRVNQITTEKAAKIREWLIKQQSGMMQGLFAHMLGDLKLFEEIDVVVQVPPLAGQAAKGRTIVLFPEKKPVER